MAVGVAYFYHQADRRLRTDIQQVLARYYPHLKLSLGSVELVKESDREGILVRGLRLAEPASEGWEPLLECEEVFLSCPTDLGHLLRQEVPVEQIRIRRPTFYLRCREGGHWNVENLRPQGNFQQGAQPELLLEDGTVVVLPPPSNPAGRIVLWDLQLRVTNHQQHQSTLPKESPKARIDSPFQGQYFWLSLSGQGVERLEMDGWVDLAGGDWAVRGKVNSWELNPQWQQLAPSGWLERWTAKGTFQGQVDLSFQAGHRPSRQEPIWWELTGRLANGRFHEPRLPYPLTDIWAVFRADVDGLRVEQLFARHGAGTVRLRYQRNGYRADSPFRLEAEVRDLELRREWLELVDLFGRLAKPWELYRPSGRVHLYLVLEYDGQHWFPEVTVECTDVSFLYAKFPYRLEHGQGRLELRNDTLWIHLTAFSETQPVQITGEVFHPLTHPSGWVEIEAQRLPLDQKFFDALNGPTRRFLAPLHPQGMVDVAYRWEHTEPNSPPHRHILLQLRQGTICYERFPYPIRNLQGTLEFQDGRWEFWALTGSNGSAQLRGYGHLIPIEQISRPLRTSPAYLGEELESGFGSAHAGQELIRAAANSTVRPMEAVPGPGSLPPMELYVHLMAEKLSLDEELRDALPAAAQRLWNHLRPVGQVHLPELEIRYRTGAPSAHVRFTARPVPERCSLQPVAFPYRLENLEGTLFFANNQVFWQKFRATHGPVRISADVAGQFHPDGSWRLEMNRLFVDRLTVDRELLKALPERLKKIFTTLNPEGSLALRGRWELAQAAAPSAAQSAQWDLALTLVGMRLNPGLPVENIYGGVRLAGESRDQQYFCWGELDLDCLMFQGFQMTQVQGPFWLDNHYLVFGPDAHTRRLRYLALQEASPPSSQQKAGELITGQWLGGRVTGQGWVRLGPQAEFALRVGLAEAQLHRLAQEHLPGTQDLRGKLYGWIYLHGIGKNIHTFTGRGALHLRQADVYQLPLMIALLKVLNLRPPDTNAFSACDLEYRIAGPHIYLDRIAFQGDLISLHGAGETNFQGELHLALSPILGREDRKPPLLKYLLGQAGQEVMVIWVTGTLEDPKTEKEVFPTLNQALQSLQGVASFPGPEGGLRSASPGQLVPNGARRLPPPVLERLWLSGSQPPIRQPPLSPP